MQSTLPAWVNCSISKAWWFSALMHHVRRFVASSPNAAHARQSWVHRLTELGHDDDVVNGQHFACSVLRHDRRLAAPDALDLHRFAVLVGAEHHRGAATYRVVRQSHALGQMRLEDQTKRRAWIEPCRLRCAIRREGPDRRPSRATRPARQPSTRPANCIAANVGDEERVASDFSRRAVENRLR